jgi:formate dehydrogenase beta subunit
VAFGHTTKIAKRVIVLGGGNTAMDCCRSARRLGGEDVKVIVRSGFEEMKASPWEKEEAIHEGIPIINMRVPKEFRHDNGKLTGVLFEIVRAEYDAKGRRSLIPTGEPDEFHECDEVLVAIGQENAFPWIEKDIGLEFDKWDMPVLNEKTLQSTCPRSSSAAMPRWGRRTSSPPRPRATRPRFRSTCSVAARSSTTSAAQFNLVSQKMGIHEWSYDNQVSEEERKKVPVKALEKTLKDIKLELEMGFDPFMACAEAERCLNCDMQTVFTARPASSAMPASTSVRPNASPSPQRRRGRPARPPQGAGEESRPGAVCLRC